MKMQTFTFGRDFRLRPAGDADILLAREWTELDPWHRKTTKPEFWLEQNPWVDSYIMEDFSGPVFFFKLVQMKNPSHLRVYMQFSPDKGPLMGLRTVRGMLAGFAWLERRLSGLGYEALYFDSKSPSLIEFCKNHLHFQEQDGQLVRTIKKMTVN